MAQQGEQMRDVAVDVAVGQQAEEVEGLAGADAVGDQRLPCGGFKKLAVFDRLADELGALRVDLAAAQRVVADLRVAHIVVGGQADGRPVRLEPSMRAGCKQMIERRSVRDRDCVAAAAVTLADAVHNY